jgi:hypothetical protein
VVQFAVLYLVGWQIEQVLQIAFCVPLQPILSAVYALPALMETMRFLFALKRKIPSVLLALHAIPINKGQAVVVDQTIQYVPIAQHAHRVNKDRQVV